MLEGKELEKFDWFDRIMGGQSYLALYHHHDHEKLLEVMLELYLDGSKYQDLNVDRVRHWAESKGWPESSAQDLGMICDTIYETLVYVGKIKR